MANNADNLLINEIIQCIYTFVPEEGWFGQPKYSTPEKNLSTNVDFCFYFLDSIREAD